VTPIVLEPNTLFGWILLGLIAGWIAGVITRIAIGLVGAVVGGGLFSLLGLGGFVGFFGSLAIAVAGSALVLALANALT